MMLINLLVLIFFASCSVDNSCELTEDEKLVNSVMYEVAKKLKKEKKLIPCGSGGQMMNEVKLLRLMFDYHSPVEIEEGRELLIAAAEEFVFQINAKEELRQYLYRYPFQLKDVEIEIYIHNPDGTPKKNGKIEVMKIERGVVKFKADDPGHPFMRTIHHETIEEALSQIANPSTEPLVLKPLPRTKLPEPGDKKMGIGFCG